MPLTRIKLKEFTVFKDLDIAPSPGINIFIGENGTGKTHLLKAAYSACSITETKTSFAEKLQSVFMPDSIGRLVKRHTVSSKCYMKFVFQRDLDALFSDRTIECSFSNHAVSEKHINIKESESWISDKIESVFIPVKEILSNAPGFLSLYREREISFEEIYADVISKAFKPAIKGPLDGERTKLMKFLEKGIYGKIIIKGEKFYLKNKQGELEFLLLAEGLRKLGLIWILIRNGTLQNGSIIFWDEPEANLNPKLIRPLVGILIELQKMGVQIFIATHSYVVVKEFELQTKKDDKILYHSLYFETGDKDKENLLCLSTPNYYDLKPNDILTAYDKILEDEIKRSL